MAACQCEGIESRFDREYAATKLDEYRRAGPDERTSALLDALRVDGVDGMSLLDIGGGIGAIQHELLKSGLDSAVEVEGSRACVEACRFEAERQGHGECIEHLHGDFTELADAVEAADIVTLDGVICCWHDMPALVGRSAHKAKRLYGLVYPRDAWWIRLGWRGYNNAAHRLRGNPLRLYVHRTRDVETAIRESGLERRFLREMGVWQVAVFARS